MCPILIHTECRSDQSSAPQPQDTAHGREQRARAALLAAEREEPLLGIYHRDFRSCASVHQHSKCCCTRLIMHRWRNQLVGLPQHRHRPRTAWAPEYSGQRQQQRRGFRQPPPQRNSMLAAVSARQLSVQGALSSIGLLGASKSRDVLFRDHILNIRSRSNNKKYHYY